MLILLIDLSYAIVATIHNSDNVSVDLNPDWYLVSSRISFMDLCARFYSVQILSVNHGSSVDSNNAYSRASCQDVGLVSRFSRFRSSMYNSIGAGILLI